MELVHFYSIPMQESHLLWEFHFCGMPGQLLRISGWSWPFLSVKKVVLVQSNSTPHQFVQTECFFWWVREVVEGFRKWIVMTVSEMFLIELDGWTYTIHGGKVFNLISASFEMFLEFLLGNRKETTKSLWMAVNVGISNNKLGGQHSLLHLARTVNLLRNMIFIVNWVENKKPGESTQEKLVLAL